MKSIFLLLFPAILIAAGCEDDTPASKPGIVHIHLDDVKVRYNQPVPLDVDDNGDSEFVFNATLIADAIGDHLRFTIISRYDNAVIGDNGNVEVLSFDEPINPGSTFGTDNEVLVIKTTTNDGTSWWGNWKDVQNAFIGIRFTINGSVRYGWIKVSVSEPNEQLVIHEMAYIKRNTPDGILAGDHGE